MQRPACPCVSPDPLPLHWGCSCPLGCCGKGSGHHHSSPKVFSCQISLWLIVLHIPVPATPAPRRCRALVLRSVWESSLLHTPDGSAFVFSAYLSAPRLLRVMWIWEGKKEQTSPAANRKNNYQEVSFSRVISKQRECTQEAFRTFSERREIKRGADMESSSVSKQCGQLRQCSLCSRDRWDTLQTRLDWIRLSSNQCWTRLSNTLAAFQLHCIMKSRYFPL